MLCSHLHAHGNLHFYWVINPTNGPTKRSNPFFHFKHRYNKDWTTAIARLNALDNAQGIGYVSTSYNNAFGIPSAPQYTAVLNAGVRPLNSTYERDLFDLADAVIARETCWQVPSSAKAGPCPLPYEPYNTSTLIQTGGLPSNFGLYLRASIAVHYVRPKPLVDSAILTDQIKKTVHFGIHSLYLTSVELWETTVLEPATIGAVTQAVDTTQYNHQTLIWSDYPRQCKDTSQPHPDTSYNNIRK
ncbi:hypothetical protein SCUP515_12270 [Seiridium cupressi]